MKKILAIAVATAISAPAMADMTIGGTYAFGYTDTAGDSGFGTDTAAISIAASGEVVEGVSIKAGISAGGFTRGADAVTGENAYMTLSGDFGSVTLAEVESGSGIRGLGQAGAPVNNMEGEVLGAAGNISILKYVAPAMGAVKLDVAYAGSPAMGSGEEKGVYVFGATANLGNVTVRADYSDWESAASSVDRTRLSAQIALGALTLGAGVESRTYVDSATTTAGDRDNSILGASYAVSDATKVGVVYTDATESDGTEKDGYSLGMSHAFGGNLSLSANYSDWDVDAASENKTNVILAYSF
jgi:hypothetical protein